MTSFPTALPNDNVFDLPAGNLQQRVISRLNGMTDETSRKLRNAQERYKRYSDQKVRFTHTVTPNDVVFIDKPPPSEKKQADQFYALLRLKILRKSDGPYPVIR